MPKLISPDIKAECVRLRREERLTSCAIQKRLARHVSLTMICQMVKHDPLKAREKGNSGRRAHTPWTDDEERILRRLWPLSSPSKIMGAIPGHSWTSISKQASKRKLTRKREANNDGQERRHIDPIFKMLREIREERRVTRPELSERIGNHYINIANWELGYVRPSWLMFRAWIDALNIQLVPRA